MFIIYCFISLLMFTTSTNICLKTSSQLEQNPKLYNKNMASLKIHPDTQPSKPSVKDHCVLQSASQTPAPAAAPAGVYRSHLHKRPAYRPQRRQRVCT